MHEGSLRHSVFRGVPSSRLVHVISRATENAMCRELQGESQVMGAWLETSITGLHALVARIQACKALSQYA